MFTFELIYMGNKYSQIMSFVWNFRRVHFCRDDESALSPYLCCWKQRKHYQ